MSDHLDYYRPIDPLSPGGWYLVTGLSVPLWRHDGRWWTDPNGSMVALGDWVTVARLMYAEEAEELMQRDMAEAIKDVEFQQAGEAWAAWLDESEGDLRSEQEKLLYEMAWRQPKPEENA